MRDVHSVTSALVPSDNPLSPLRVPHTLAQICREAEAAIFHQQLFEELRRLTPLSSDPTEVTAIGAVESSFKCCAGAIIVLTTSGRCVYQTYYQQTIHLLDHTLRLGLGFRVRLSFLKEYLLLSAVVQWTVSVA